MTSCDTLHHKRRRSRQWDTQHTHEALRRYAIRSTEKQNYCDQQQKHGTHAVVHVTVDAGEIPVAQVKTNAQILWNLKEYRALRQFLADEVTALNAGGYLPREQWNRKIALQTAIRHAATLTSHAGRMKALKSVSTPQAAPQQLQTSLF